MIRGAVPLASVVGLADRIDVRLFERRNVPIDVDEGCLQSREGIVSRYVPGRGSPHDRLGPVVRSVLERSPVNEPRDQVDLRGYALTSENSGKPARLGFDRRDGESLEDRRKREDVHGGEHRGDVAPRSGHGDGGPQTPTTDGLLDFRKHLSSSDEEQVCVRADPHQLFGYVQEEVVVLVPNQPAYVADDEGIGSDIDPRARLAGGRTDAERPEIDPVGKHSPATILFPARAEQALRSPTGRGEPRSGILLQPRGGKPPVGALEEARVLADVPQIRVNVRNSNWNPATMRGSKHETPDEGYVTVNDVEGAVRREERSESAGIRRRRPVQDATPDELRSERANFLFVISWLVPVGEEGQMEARSVDPAEHIEKPGLDTTNLLDSDQDVKDS